MIAGQVDALKQATIPLRFLSAAGRAVEVTAIVDTGFDGTVTAEQHVISQCAFPFLDVRSYELGDGGFTDLPTYQGTVDWDGNEVTVTVVASGSGTLVGMALLTGYTLFVDVIDGGRVEITERPSAR